MFISVFITTKGIQFIEIVCNFYKIGTLKGENEDENRYRESQNLEVQQAHMT